jgi:glycosyltransferase involved in cell wall biosynthesis
MDRRESKEADPTITACILARNEERRIEDALRSLQGWTDQVLLIDNESEDRTVEIARRYTDEILTAPVAANFDAARNLAIEAATGGWIFYLDADERVPPRLGPVLRRLVREEGEQFEALVVPFRHYFCGQWMQHSGWWPGYCRPQLLKKGRFRYNERLHSGVRVEGRTCYFPCEDPELAIVHYSYDDLHHYLEKLNRYTDGEAESLLADGKSHAWQAMLAHFVHDWQQYYERGRADLDGMHGFVLAFMSAFYRFASRAKLWDLRRQRGEWNEQEPVPADLREMLRFMAQVAQHGAEGWLDRREGVGGVGSVGGVGGEGPLTSHTPHTPHTSLLPLLWRGPLFDPSGYADEGRQFVLGLIEAGEEVAVWPERWGQEEAGLAPEARAQIEERAVPAGSPAELYVYHTLAALQEPSPQARFNIGRTMFETDRLPAGWAERLNRMDRLWVPSEFNRETFVRSGVAPEKIAVVPGAIDPAPFAAEVEPLPLPFLTPHTSHTAHTSHTSPFLFLSVFDWTLHKGWDVLLEAFAAEFGADPEVGLVVKTWSSHHYTLEDLREQADALLRRRLGKELAEFPNIHLWWENLPASELPRLYHAVDAFVMPTRGEGWCRPLMEAMAAGLPTIATAWSGLTAFHSARVGYPLAYALVPVPEAAAREIPVYRGHCWAEPDVTELRRLMRRLVEKPEEARKKGRAAQQHVRKHFSRAAVTRLLQTELAQCRRLGEEMGTWGNEEMGGEGTPISSQHPNTSTPQHPGFFRPPANPVPVDPVSPVDFREALGRPLRVCWEGDQALLSSLALVNREFCLGLLQAGDVELTLVEHRIPWHTLTERDDPRFGPLFALRDAPLSGPPDITVRHHFPPNWERPEAGKLVVIQPWEYGHLPREWVAGATQADEVWVYSRWVRDVYVRSGVPAEKVRVVPLGFNPEVFTPHGPLFDLRGGGVGSMGSVGGVGGVGTGDVLTSHTPHTPHTSHTPTLFLFVGGTLDRKGADLLLEAYCRAFTAADDVCLVVKDMGTRTFYRGGTFADAFRQAEAAYSPPRIGGPEGRTATPPGIGGLGGPPQVLYLDDDLSDAELAALYRACHCVVLPYRGEGFGLPPLEGMACGLLPIVTAGGPTDDYVDDATALRLPFRRRPAGSLVVGDRFSCVGDPWQLEPDLEALVGALRWVHEHPEEARQRGEAARDRVYPAWTWEQAAARARERLLTLVEPRGAERGARGAGSSVIERHGQDARATPEDPSASTPERLNARTPVPELSLCMIVRDEAERIAECLQSIAPHVDEMVVVDTGSTDRTREIARECGARVFEMEWPDSFAEARNRSLEQARGEWIFWMDADDVISPECGKGLRELVRRHPDRDAAYQVQVRIPPGEGEFSEAVVDHVKLFPGRANGGPDLRFEHRIHEQILPSIRRAGLQVLFSDLYVTHRNYDRSEAGQAKKRRRDFRLLELDLKDHPDHPFVLFNLGMTYLYATKEYEVAAHYLRRSLDRSEPQDSIVRKAYAMLTQARVCQREWCAALEANEEGRTYYPEDAELLFQAGQIYQQVGRFAEARRALERLVAGGEDPHYRSVDVGLRTYRGRHELALLFQRLGDAPHCEHVLQEIAAENPAYLPAQLDLVETLARVGKRAEAERLLDRIPAVKGVAEELERLRELVSEK